MTRSMPLPVGIYKRSILKTAGGKWLSVLPCLAMSFFLLIGLRKHTWGAGRADTGMPCGAATEILPVLKAAKLTEEDLVAHKDQPVLLHARLHPEDIEDGEFALKYSGVFLRRSVEMYQWSRDGAEYSKHWYPNVIDSGGHTRGHLNPLAMPFHDAEVVASPILLENDLKVSPLLSPQFTFSHRVPITTEDLEHLPPDLQGTFRVIHNYFFRGRDMRYPSVGDVRVSFSGIGPGNVTLIGKLEGKEIVPCKVRMKTPDAAQLHEQGGGGFVAMGHLNLIEMRALYSKTSEHGYGIPWWVIILGLLHVIAAASVGFFVLMPGAARMRETRSDRSD